MKCISRVVSIRFSLVLDLFVAASGFLPPKGAAATARAFFAGMETAALAAADLDPDFVTDGSQVLKRKTTASSGVDEVCS
jgi:hypothetical protein